MHCRRKWQPTPVFLPGESQGRGSLVGCRLWGRTESDMTEATEQQQHTVSLLLQCLFPSSGKWWPLSGAVRTLLIVLASLVLQPRL